MKSILLFTANVTNAGAFLDAGTNVDVGDEKDQISAARAEAAIACRGAEEVTPVAANDGAKPRK